ncbi:MAG: hypothetical protein JW881_09690 [Spirochaetales bacterium]|nr:hypothetical protein [Spirochaetales bacterium]
MKHIAYAHKNGEGPTLYLFDREEPIDSSANFDALMMSRLDFDIKVTTVPPVHQSEMGNILTYKLRSLYPGDPEDTIFDFKVLTQNKQRYAVLFISSKDTINEYKELANNKPLILPFPILAKLTKKYDGKNCVFFFWHKDWVDISLFEEGVFKSSSAIKREKEVFLDFLKIKNMLPKNLEEYVCVFLCLRDESSYLEEQSRELVQNAGTVEFLPIEESLSLISNKTDYLFRKKKQSFIFHQKLKIEMLAVPLVILVCLLFNKYVETRAEYYRKLKKEKDTIFKISSQRDEYNKKRAELARILEHKPADVFLLLSEINRVFGQNLDLTYFRLETKETTVMVDNKRERQKRYYFTIEGSTRGEPYTYQNALNSNPYFEEVLVPLITREKFRMTGIFNKGAGYAVE